jgi:hypothetical protein
LYVTLVNCFSKHTRIPLTDRIYLVVYLDSFSLLVSPFMPVLVRLKHQLEFWEFPPFVTRITVNFIPTGATSAVWNFIVQFAVCFDAILYSLVDSLSTNISDEVATSIFKVKEWFTSINSVAISEHSFSCYIFYIFPSVIFLFIFVRLCLYSLSTSIAAFPSLCKYCHVYECDSRRGVGLDIGFLDYLYTQLVTTSNYSAIANVHNLQFAVTHT